MTFENEHLIIEHIYKLSVCAVGRPTSQQEHSHLTHIILFFILQT